MRYNRFIENLERLKAKYEAEIRKLLAEMKSEDQEIERAILKKSPVLLRTDHRSSWTPARRAKQSRIMKRRMRAKHGKAKS